MKITHLFQHGGGLVPAARIFGEGAEIHSLTALFKNVIKSGDQLVHINSTLYNRISSQWLSKLR